MGLLEQYKGEQSNYECIKGELENVLSEFEDVNRLKVDEVFCNEVLERIKEIRMSIAVIS